MRDYARDARVVYRLPVGEERIITIDLIADPARLSELTVFGG